MKSGKTLTELAQELERQQATKRDLAVDTREITMLNGSELLIGTPKPGLSLTTEGEWPVRPIAHRQISEFLDIPGKYYERLQRSHPTLLDKNVNELMRANPKVRMVRTLDGQVRAFLSNRYRRLDHADLLQTILPVLAEMPDIQFPSLEVTDSRLYIHAVNPRLQGDVKVGDTVQAGVLIRNSEVGLGSLEIAGFVYVLRCTNGMVTGDAVKRSHVGRRIETGDGDDAYEIFKDETLKADDRAFFLKVRDMTQAALTEARFQQTLRKMQLAATGQQIVDPSAGVNVLAQRFAFTETEAASVLRHLATGGDLTRWGALNAVTRAAHDVDSYDRSVELQVIGGEILDLDPKEWTTIAEPRQLVAA